jgi:hypothetical protein
MAVNRRAITLLRPQISKIIQVKMKLKLFLLTTLAIFLFPVYVSAFDATFSVRLGQPKSPTNQNNFKLTFVALDTRTDRHITVKCYKKGPSDGDYSQFDIDKELIYGGNTDYCDVTSSILNANGTYSFKVVGSVTTPAGEEHTGGPVTVELNTSGPSTPVSYSKERLNDCDYKIKFKTANDGKTVKVQLFRSDTLNISVGSGSVLTQQNIGPDQEGSITNSVPVCGKDYYYVIRAVDSSDNASGTIGDSFTTTTTTTTTTTVTGTTGAIALSGASTQIIDVAGTGTGETGSELPVTDITLTPSVLGTETDNKKELNKWLLVLAGLLVIFFLSRFLKKKKSK